MNKPTPSPKHIIKETRPDVISNGFAVGVLSTFFIIVIITMLLVFSSTCRATTFGPYDITVNRIIDGDTIDADIHVWPDFNYTASIRLAGVNAPETRSGPECERQAGQQAKSFVFQTIYSANHVIIDSVKRDKYGRVLARVLVDGKDLGQLIINAGHGVAYNGGKRAAWDCNK